MRLKTSRTPTTCTLSNGYAPIDDVDASGRVVRPADCPVVLMSSKVPAYGMTDGSLIIFLDHAVMMTLSCLVSPLGRHGYARRADAIKRMRPKAVCRLKEGIGNNEN
jgi:hypothetical protein